MTLAQAHPASLLSTLAKHVKAFEFGIYRYSPQSVEDSRRTVCVDSSSLTAFFPAVLDALASDEELAIHSRVYVSSQTRVEVFHLPMIDFRWVNLERSRRPILDRISDFLGDRAEVFFSGRSYHLYGLRLLDHAEWIRFMGRLLLLNPPGGPEIVDSRWVGHRLLAGYGSLRWSWNSTQYRGMPTFIEKLLPRATSLLGCSSAEQLSMPFQETTRLLGTDCAQCGEAGGSRLVQGGDTAGKVLRQRVSLSNGEASLTSGKPIGTSG